MTEDDALEYFARHGLAARGLSQSKLGFNNAVWLTDDFVLRVSKNANSDHMLEAQLALHALSLGVHTPCPLFWQRHYSIWQRLPSETVRTAQPVQVWNDLLDDLEHWHAAPPFAAPSPEIWVAKPFPWDRTLNAPGTWDGDLRLLETAFAQQLTRLERKRIARSFAPRRLERLHFLHGDAFSANVVVQNGVYMGLIDWGNAQWHALEREFAWMEDDALELALQRYDLDLSLVYAMRLELLLKVGEVGHATREDVRRALEGLSRR
jgi:hypothetical protein